MGHFESGRCNPISLDTSLPNVCKMNKNLAKQLLQWFLSVSGVQCQVPGKLAGMFLIFSEYCRCLLSYRRAKSSIPHCHQQQKH